MASLPPLDYAGLHAGTQLDFDLGGSMGLGQDFDARLGLQSHMGGAGSSDVESDEEGSTHSQDADAGLSELNSRYEALVLEQKKLLSEQKIQQLKNENSKLLLKLQSSRNRSPLRAEPPVAPDHSSHLTGKGMGISTATKDDEARLTIAQLRAQKALSLKADQEFQSLRDLLQSGDGAASGDLGPIDQGKAQKKVRSGLRDTELDTVVRHMKCPQAHLGMKYSSVPLKFEQLDLRLFVAGELNIICAENQYMIPEHRGRLSLLQDIVYSAGHYEWSAVSNYYGQIIHELEAEVRQWGDSRSELRSQVLAPFVKSSPSSVESQSGGYGSSRSRRRDDRSPSRSDRPSVMYCYDYNHSSCSAQAPHVANIRGKPYAVHHICSRCLSETKVKAEHPQSDPSCPLQPSQ